VARRPPQSRHAPRCLWARPQSWETARCPSVLVPRPRNRLSFCSEPLRQAHDRPPPTSCWPSRSVAIPPPRGGRRLRPLILTPKLSTGGREARRSSRPPSGACAVLLRVRPLRPWPTKRRPGVPRETLLRGLGLVGAGPRARPLRFGAAPCSLGGAGTGTCPYKNTPQPHFAHRGESKQGRAGRCRSPASGAPQLPGIPKGGASPPFATARTAKYPRESLRFPRILCGNRDAPVLVDGAFRPIILSPNGRPPQDARRPIATLAATEPPGGTGPIGKAIKSAGAMLGASAGMEIPAVFV